MGEISRHLKAKGLEINRSKLSAKRIIELLKLQEDGIISGKIAKLVIEEMLETGLRPADIIKEKSLVQISDEGELAGIVEKVIFENPKPVDDYQSGNDKAIGFLVGQVMMLSKGKANPGLVNKILAEKLKQV